MGKWVGWVIYLAVVGMDEEEEGSGGECGGPGTEDVFALYGKGGWVGGWVGGRARVGG